MSCYNSVVVSAPAEEVWKVLRNFHDMSWSETIKEVEKVGEVPGTHLGAQRILNDQFEETLLELDDANMYLEYSIDDGPYPVSKDHVRGYKGEVKVHRVTDDDTCFVEWSSSWDSHSLGVEEFCNSIYRSLLKDLKEAFSVAIH